jgi:hypothetical protein
MESRSRGRPRVVYQHARIAERVFPAPMEFWRRTGRSDENDYSKGKHGLSLYSTFSRSRQQRPCLRTSNEERLNRYQIAPTQVLAGQVGNDNVGECATERK